MSTIIEKLAARAKVRVFKPYPRSDDRQMICGEELQQGVNAEGEPAEFWEIPAHQGDYINGAFSQYTVSEPFLPGEEPTAILDKEFACQVEGCGKVFKRQQDLTTHIKVAHKE